jgi:hypothetical protein
MICILGPIRLQVDRSAAKLSLLSRSYQYMQLTSLPLYILRMPGGHLPSPVTAHRPTKIVAPVRLRAHDEAFHIVTNIEPVVTLNPLVLFE